MKFFTVLCGLCIFSSLSNVVLSSSGRLWLESALCCIPDLFSLGVKFNVVLCFFYSYHVTWVDAPTLTDGACFYLQYM